MGSDGFFAKIRVLPKSKITRKIYHRQVHPYAPGKAEFLSFMLNEIEYKII